MGPSSIYQMLGGEKLKKKELTNDDNKSDLIPVEIKGRINSGDARYHADQNVVSFRLLSTTSTKV
jgi:hypothetical protein